MSLKIDQDHSRFRAIVRGKIRQNLRKYISQGELIGRKGKDLVSIPIPQIDIPRFSLRRQAAGRRRAGRRRARRSRWAASEAEDGDGKQAGKDAGRARPRGRRHARRARGHPGRGARAPGHPGQGQEQDHQREGPLHGHPPRRPRVAPPLQAHLPRGAQAPDLHGHLRARQPRRRPHPDRQALPELEDRGRARRQRRHHLHDGRLRLDGRRAEGDRAHRELLDRCVAAEAVQGPREPLHHPRRRRARGRPRHVLPHARERRHDDLQRVQALLAAHRRPLPARRVEHLPVPLLRRRQLVDGRHARCASTS